MSSWHCIKCKKRIWDKNIGYIGRTYETKITVNKTLGSQVVVICGFCGSDQDE